MLISLVFSICALLVHCNRFSSLPVRCWHAAIVCLLCLCAACILHRFSTLLCAASMLQSFVFSVCSLLACCNHITCFFFFVFFLFFFLLFFATIVCLLFQLFVRCLHAAIVCILCFCSAYMLQLLVNSVVVLFTHCNRLFSLFIRCLYAAIVSLLHLCAAYMLRLFVFYISALLACCIQCFSHCPLMAS